MTCPGPPRNQKVEGPEFLSLRWWASLWFSSWRQACVLVYMAEDKKEKASVQFSHSVVSNSLWPQGLQHDRLHCPSPFLAISQTHVHWVSDAIKLSQPLESPSPPTFTLSQHQGLFQWVNSLHQEAKVLELQLQHQSFQWIFRTDFL